MKFHPKLSALGRAALRDAVAHHERGLSPVIALLYAKPEKAKSGRRPGVDFVALPGVAPNAHIGTVVAVRDGKLRLKDLTRADGQTAGNSYLSIERVIEIAIIASQPSNSGEAKPRRRMTPTPPTRERDLKGRTSSIS